MTEIGTVTAASKREAAGGGSRVLATSCAAHMLHDGFSDLLYVLLPVWQAEFALSLVQVGLLKTLYSGFMASLQMPAGLLAERIGERSLLVLGTALAGGGYLLAGWSGSFFALCCCLALGGTGSSVQHPISASLTARAFEGKRLRAALSTYNFSGDIGKVALPAATAWLIAGWQWRWATTALGGLGLLVALGVLMALHANGEGSVQRPTGAAKAEAHPRLEPAMARRGFGALAAIGVIDSATRTGFLTFLPFLLIAKGASVPTVGLALSLIFAGGATGKFVCGVIAAQVGILRTVILTEIGTAAGIVMLLPLPIEPILFMLPLIGVALNGTSSVVYGTVAELAPAESRARAFGLFYTVTIGAGAVSPTVYGLFSDALGVPLLLVVVASVVLLVLPLTMPLRAPLRRLNAS